MEVYFPLFSTFPLLHSALVEAPQSIPKQLYIPLQFWFTKPPRKTEKKEKFHAFIDQISNKHDDFHQLLKDYEEAKVLARRALYENGFFWSPGQTIYDVELEKILKYIDEYCNIPGYDDIILISSCEYVNGLQMFDCSINMIRWDEFDSHSQIWTNSKNWDDMQFERYLEEKLRYNRSFTDCDPHGDLVSVQDSDNTFTRNINSLTKLPYPRDYIIKTIDMTDGYLNQSVRLVNFYCEWLRRKLAQVDIARQKAKMTQQQMILNLCSKATSA